MNKVLIIGSSGHAKVIIDIIRKQAKYEIFGLIDSYKSKGTRISDYEVLGTEKELPEIIATNDIYGGIIAIGDNWTRKKLYKEIVSSSENFRFITVIHPDAVIAENIVIGHGTAIMAGVVINSSVTIGKQCIINTKSSIGHDVILKDFCSIAPGVTIGGEVKINKCTAISLGSNIIECIKIGKHTVIGAGALVNKNIEDFKTAYGVPVKNIKDRKKDDKYLGVLSTTKASTYKLEFHTISKEADIKEYYTVLKEFETFSTFYSLQYCNYRGDSKLSYFVLRKTSRAKVLMPVYLNVLKNEGVTDIQFFDSTSPYGYSGPLLNGASNDDIKAFWKKVDKWYKKNNVVTEFIRFNLNNNHIYYSGHLIPSLNNVKGKIHSFESIWNNFKQKVRNNYRRAEKNNLKTKIYSEDITTEVINTFYSIYIKTMQRNAAAKNYFYPLSYFKDLIENNQGKILIAVVHKESTPISTELIIIDGDTLYSYLGGTLAEYFDTRPNDFLKIEVTKWAIENDKKYYILGGGRKDFDGLYQYKKSFFPKDNDVVFYTGRKVINEKIYNRLIKEIKVSYTDAHALVSNSNTYFPIYKQISNQKVKENGLNVITSKSAWQNILNQVNNYDFYHTFDYHELSKEKDEKAVLIKYTEGDILIGLPLIIRKIGGTGYFDATSVYGYSGPLQKNVPQSFDNSGLVKALNQYFKDENIISVFSRLNPFIKRQSEILKNMGHVVELGNVVNIDLTLPLDEQRTIFSKTTKRYLNKGRRSLKVICSHKERDIKAFIKLYYENMDRVNAKSNYYFSEEYFKKFINSNDFKVDVLFAINLETNAIVSAAMMVKTNNIIQYHISGTRNDFLAISPIRLLIDEMRIRATKEEYTFFNLGGGLGNEEDELFRFKSSFSKDFKSFKVWKYITNYDVYNELSINVKQEEVDFFPLYRYQE
ncbi:NeuD/PglB/VioB family sugar acetyltransferase [Tamlana sp. 2201CG12-4]|uniref:NeuD/PglB/VioB family sugar acetyltransferase n=1 Tax=Tamlana sp. 2201CG12-4 TaxID=3112582 RepID=UPI002DB9C2B3|nr:NeuD/PglB/VioB family sugar acetyltransferase [Tamlana sp. 2201CG12-4]MEC3908017.1 NeuD/PglB/VioB family sugar acetyltransferase [Tamlana sp. 2201CG12-4]